jgi:hypothetical protein
MYRRYGTWVQGTLDSALQAVRDLLASRWASHSGEGTARPFHATHHPMTDVSPIGSGTWPPPGEVSACLLGQASWDRHARALPRRRRCLLRFTLENHDNAGATA